MPNWEYKYRITGKLDYNGTPAYLHEENFRDFIGVYRYHTKLFPTFLTRLDIDKKLFDHIINNADNIQIHITITKMEMSNHDSTKHSTEVVFLDSDMNVVLSSDLNYNDALDYIETKTSGKPREDIHRETYIGLVPSECLDANKLVINENIHQSMMQDVILNYFDSKGLHLLIEKFDHNKYIEQLILPPMDTTYSLIEYLNNMNAFYSTKYILFFEEPHITYLISKKGNAIQAKDELWKDVIINVHSPADEKNVLQGMTVDGWTCSYIVDIVGNESTFTIDNTTNQVFDSIAAILNPSISNTKIMEDAFNNIKKALKKSMDSFIESIIGKSGKAGNMGIKLSTVIPKMDHSVLSCDRATKDLLTTVHTQTMEAINAIPNSITKTTETGGTITIPFMSDLQKSILKTTMDAKFVDCSTEKLRQKAAQENFNAVINSTANQYYKTDFLDNNVRAVTYINIQDVSKMVDNAIKSINKGTTACLNDMLSKVVPNMGSFTALPNNLGNMKGMIDPIILQLQSILDVNSGSQNETPEEGMAALEKLTYISGCFGTMQTKTDKYGQIGIGAQALGASYQTLLKGFSDSFQKAIGMFSLAGKIDIKGKMISIEPLRQFGDRSLNSFISKGVNDSLTKYVGQATKVLSSNITKITAVTNVVNGGLPALTSQLMDNCVGGLVKMTDLKNLSKNIEKFDLSGISKLGLNNIAFDLNIGGKTNKKTVGTKLLKVRNDNPNQLKNIKSELELNKNEFSFHKMGLDCSVFSPNKKYTINNFSGYSNKNGGFLLKEKVIIFAREDKFFSCDTKLTFAKIVPETATNNETNKAKSTSTPNPQEANKV